MSKGSDKHRDLQYLTPLIGNWRALMYLAEISKKKKSPDLDLGFVDLINLISKYEYSEASPKFQLMVFFSKSSKLHVEKCS